MPIHPASAAALPTIVITPGLDGSGPDHWQSLWEDQVPNCRRIEVPDWSRPDRNQWVESLGRAGGRTPGKIIIVAHSLGCHTVVWWAKLWWRSAYRDKIVASLLVAPPCLGKECRSARLFGFRPVPKDELPFPTILVASRNDPYCAFATAEHLSEYWGSRLADAGHVGHINVSSGIGDWEDWLALLESLMAADANQSIRQRLQLVPKAQAERSFGAGDWRQ